MNITLFELPPKKKHVRFLYSDLTSYDFLPVKKLQSEQFCNLAARRLYEAFLRLPTGIVRGFVPLFLEYVQRTKKEYNLNFTVKS